MPEITPDQSVEAEMTREEVIRLMESSRTQEDWNANRDRVKQVYDGYPSFWFKDILQSGLAGRVTGRFGRDDQIHVQTITLE